MSLNQAMSIFSFGIISLGIGYNNLCLIGYGLGNAIHYVFNSFKELEAEE